MKYIFALVILTMTASLYASEAEDLYAQGLDLLRAGKIVDAAKALAQASDKFEAAGNDALASDSASALFWCRKKMTLNDCAALKGTDEKAAAKAEAVVTRKAEPSDAEKALAKANSFAAGHQNDQLLVAIKYFEVASLYKGSDFGFKAMDLSLAAMGKVKNEPAKVEPTKNDLVIKKSEKVDPVSKSAPAQNAPFMPMVGKWIAGSETFVLEFKDGEFSLTQEPTGLHSERCIICKDKLIFEWSSNGNAFVLPLGTATSAVLYGYWGVGKFTEPAENIKLPKHPSTTGKLKRKQESR